MRNFVKLLAIAITPVLFAGGAWASKEKSLDELKAQLKQKEEEITKNPASPYNILVREFEKLEKGLADIVQKGTVTTQDLEVIRKSLKDVQGVHVYVTLLFRTSETVLKSKIYDLWKVFGALELKNREGSSVAFTYHTEDYKTNDKSGKILVNQPTSSKNVSYGVGTYADILPLWEAICLTNERKPFASDKGGSILPWMSEIFKQLAAISFVDKFQTQFKSEIDAVKNDIESLKKSTSEAEALGQQIAELEKASILNLTSALKLIA